MSEDEPKKGIREVSLEDIDQHADAFAAYGYAYLKVQRGDETVRVKVRVVSVPQDVLDELRRGAPRAPGKAQIDPATRARAILPDYTDSKYQENLEAFNRMFTRAVVGRGVDVKMTLKASGAIAQTPDDKFSALEERGLTGPHFNELAQTILRLTDWSEEERDRHFR